MPIPIDPMLYDQDEENARKRKVTSSEIKEEN
jgi:hypothetical protein